tara:strand:- start:283 stop:453 length:171 start_codon:yes stop_codon:yes gene_type:complete
MSQARIFRGDQHPGTFLTLFHFGLRKPSIIISRAKRRGVIFGGLKIVVISLIIVDE